MGSTVTEEVGVHGTYVAHGGEGDGDAPPLYGEKEWASSEWSHLPRLHTMSPPIVSLPG